MAERIDAKCAFWCSIFTFSNGGEISKSCTSRFKECGLDAIDGFMFEMVMLPIFLVNCGFKCWHLVDFSTCSINMYLFFNQDDLINLPSCIVLDIELNLAAPNPSFSFSFSKFYMTFFFLPTMFEYII